MGESIVDIGGHKYRYWYNPDTGKTEYVGPVGDAPALSEEEFFTLLFADELESKGKYRLEMDVDRSGNRIIAVTDKAGLPEYNIIMPAKSWDFLHKVIDNPGFNAISFEATVIEPGKDISQEMYQVRWMEEKGKLFILWQSSNQSRRPQVVKTEWDIIEEAFEKR